MRTIKFRTWDTRFNDMHYHADVRTWHLNMPDLEECTLMQFTGLKDRTGKEIYEGDIARWNSSTLHSKGATERALLESEVIWGEKEGAWVLKGHETFNMAIYSNIEIIGNIYESPDLLTKENK